jgi:hypothetical protein
MLSGMLDGAATIAGFASGFASLLANRAAKQFGDCSPVASAGNKRNTAVGIA